MAAANGHLEIIKFLVNGEKKHVCDVNAQNLAGNTPLRILFVF
jgi:hypothetical protein